MDEITQTEIANEDFIQHAELRIPIDNPEEVRKAFEVIAALRQRALDHLEVDDDNADCTSVEYKKVEDGMAVVEVMQVNVE